MGQVLEPAHRHERGEAAVHEEMLQEVPHVQAEGQDSRLQDTNTGKHLCPGLRILPLREDQSRFQLIICRDT